MHKGWWIAIAVGVGTLGYQVWRHRRLNRQMKRINDELDEMRVPTVDVKKGGYRD